MLDQLLICHKLHQIPLDRKARWTSYHASSPCTTLTKALEPSEETLRPPDSLHPKASNPAGSHASNPAGSQASNTAGSQAGLQFTQAFPPEFRALAVSQ